jgi:hypothetical protein
MANSTVLEIRKTHKYVGTYQHLDEWDYVGTATVTASESETDHEDPCESTKTTMIVCVEIDRGITRQTDEELVKSALRSTFTKSGCAHEYDCCGCWSTYVGEVEKITADRYMVVTRSSRNY